MCVPGPQNGVSVTVIPVLTTTNASIVDNAQALEEDILPCMQAMLDAQIGYEIQMD